MSTPNRRIINVPPPGAWRTTEIIRENGKVRVQLVSPKGTPRTLTVPR